MLFLILIKIVRDLFKIYFSILFLNYTCDWVICIMNLAITMKKNFLTELFKYLYNVIILIRFAQLNRCSSECTICHCKNDMF